MEDSADPYEVLGVARDASSDELHAAYRRLAREFHPDRFSETGGDEQEMAATRMASVNAAWEILGSAERRRQYDQATGPERRRLLNLAATLGPGFGLQLWGAGGISTRLTEDPVRRTPMTGAKRYITAWAKDLSPLRKLYPDEVAGLWLLHGSDAGDEVMEHIAALPWLEILDLRDTTVTSLGIAQLEGFDRLWLLNLNGTAINDKALETIATMTALQELSLVDTAVTDACVAHLSALPKLRVLNLTGTKVSDRGVRQLAALRTLAVLKAPGRVPLRTSLWVMRNRRDLWIG